MDTLFDAIEHITPLEVARLYSMDIRNGRTQCPFHNGHDRNLSFKRDGKYCRCFVCAQSWGAVSLYMQLSGIDSRVDAAKALAADFGIEYADEDSYEARMAAKAARDKREYEARLAEKGRADYKRRFDELCATVRECEAILRQYELSPDIEQHVDAAFSVAAQMARANEELDRMQSEAPHTDQEFINYARREPLLNGGKRCTGAVEE